MTIPCVQIAVVISLAIASHAYAQSDRPASDNLSDAFRIVTGRKDSQIRLTKQGGPEKTRLICDITSPRGIDRATLHRLHPTWPNQLVLRLHLKGLESLKITSKQTTIQWSVPSGDDHASRMSRIVDGQEVEIAKGDSLYREVTIVGSETIPLRSGYFTVEVPNAILVDNPESIQVEWIDFYRN